MNVMDIDVDCSLNHSIPNMLSNLAKFVPLFQCDFFNKQTELQLHLHGLDLLLILLPFNKSHYSETNTINIWLYILKVMFSIHTLSFIKYTQIFFFFSF